MKNLTKRNKIVFAVAAVLVVAVIGVVTFAQVGGGQLFGTDLTCNFTPCFPVISTGSTMTITTKLSVPTGSVITWSIDNPILAQFVGGNTGKSVTVKGLMAGRTMINASGGGYGSGMNISVNGDTVVWPLLTLVPKYADGSDPYYSSVTDNPIVARGNDLYITVLANGSTNNLTCTWTASSTDYVTLSGTSVSAREQVHAKSVGSPTITATCNYGTKSQRIQVYDPNNPPPIIRR